MGKTKKEWKVNARKSADVTNFERCCKCQFHKIFEDFAKGNNRIYNLTKHELKKSDKDLLITLNYLNARAKYVCHGCLTYARSKCGTNDATTTEETSTKITKAVENSFALSNSTELLGSPNKNDKDIDDLVKNVVLHIKNKKLSQGKLIF